ncbi:MAG: response regulator [Sphingobacteriales bacterium]|nr:response regulator [Sphingobacteriales bacterium]OJW33467.1 MAG: two-component system response regulator [Sphingobacteriales bacterium 46-32]
MSHEVEILLVEDNAADAEMTIRALRKAHLSNKLIHLKDGVEVLDFLFGNGAYSTRDVNQHPRVILLDIKMPKMDGIEVLRNIRANESTRTIPVVIMTSSNEDKDILASYQLGVNSYVVKPVEFDEFVKAVGNLGLYWLLTNRAVSSPKAP